MDFLLTGEQRMIKELARDTVAREIMPVIQAEEADRPLPKEVMMRLYRTLGRLGLHAPRLPESQGGGGLKYLDYGLIMEELPPFLALSIMAHESTILRFVLGATEAQKERFLPQMLSGGKILCTGISEPNVGSDPRAVETQARREENRIVLDGTKFWITNGTISDYMIVVASMGKDDNGRNLITRILVDRESSPYDAREVEAIGLRQGHLSEVVFEGCSVPVDSLLGDPGDAHGPLTITWLANRPFIGLMAVHLAQQALNACIAYVKIRKQFGRRIGEFQLVQEMISEMAVRTEASRLLCYKALSLLDAGQRSNKEASMAKWFATENCLHALSLAIQCHGAAGLTREVGLEQLYRDARMLTIPDGTSQIHQLVVAGELTGIKAFRG